MGWRKDARVAVNVVQEIIGSRRDRGRLRSRLQSRGPLPHGTFRIAVYFADADVNLYQMRQWYGPLAGLAERWPVVILSRHPSGALALLDESPVPVAYVRQVTDLEEFLDEQQIRLVLYVNQNTRNFQMLRYGRRWHVFVNHGESDKVYMTTNQFKAYDYALVAGDAAKERLSRALWDYDIEKRAIAIGRPQADHYAHRTPYPRDGRTAVFYAPTWEGDRPGASYGSVRSHGVALVRSLLATGRHRVVYRPHPRSGVVDPDYRAADRAIERMIEDANRADPTASHLVDRGAELGWQFAETDVAVVDISAMVYDRLATGRPLLVTRPVSPDAVVDTTGYLGACEWLAAADAVRGAERVDAVLTDPAAVGRLEHWSRRYFGDTSPGAPTRRFEEAVERLMIEWERFEAAETP